MVMDKHALPPLESGLQELGVRNALRNLSDLSSLREPFNSGRSCIACGATVSGLLLSWGYYYCRRCSMTPPLDWKERTSGKHLGGVHI